MAKGKRNKIKVQTNPSVIFIAKATGKDSYISTNEQKFYFES